MWNHHAGQHAGSTPHPTKAHEKKHEASILGQQVGIRPHPIQKTINFPVSTIVRSPCWAARRIQAGAGASISVLLFTLLASPSEPTPTSKIYSNFKHPWAATDPSCMVYVRLMFYVPMCPPSVFSSRFLRCHGTCGVQNLRP